MDLIDFNDIIDFMIICEQHNSFFILSIAENVSLLNVECFV